ncbi:hypothetical protein IV203_026994 [Nitzschia inconspicua]|uniref:Uncharacterized protein n=1 Tax=Nitzschia inconspicua TaxID=303405 RepID=A0A9K3LL13_9STRA|nr:hypothetical protein IV203_026994 [Nitzschia inconspicua]
MPPLSNPPTPEVRFPQSNRHNLGSECASDIVEDRPQVEQVQPAPDALSLLEKLRSITDGYPFSTEKMSMITSIAPFPEAARVRTTERRMKDDQLTDSKPRETGHSGSIAIAAPCRKHRGILKTNTTSTQKSKKKISFSSVADVRRIPNISSHNDPELACTIWYSRQQFRDMKEQYELLIKLLHHKIVEPYDYGESRDDESESIIQNEDCCSIGLDACFGRGREIADALQLGGRAAVLLEQQKQVQDGYTCDDLIRSAYEEFAEHAEVVAQRRGLNHAEAAGDWVVQGLPVEYVEWLCTHLGHQKALNSFVSNSKR